jgi:hypothetical protein
MSVEVSAMPTSRARRGLATTCWALLHAGGIGLGRGVHGCRSATRQSSSSNVASGRANPHALAVPVVGGQDGASHCTAGGSHPKSISRDAPLKAITLP